MTKFYTKCFSVVVYEAANADEAKKRFIKDLSKNKLAVVAMTPAEYNQINGYRDPVEE